MSRTPAEQKQQGIDHAVSRALLFHFSRNGGTYGKSTIQPRAARVIREGVTEDILVTLLSETARYAAEEADRQADWLLRELITEAHQVAERSDSLSFHRYVERLQARIKERDEQPRTGDMTTTDYSGIQAGTMSTDDTEILTGGLVKSLPLDPMPWRTVDSGRRYAFLNQIPEDRISEWAPRGGYEQRRDQYPRSPGTSLPLDPHPWHDAMDRLSRARTASEFPHAVWAPSSDSEQDRTKYPEDQQ